MPQADQETICVVGAGQAGCELALALRQQGCAASIIVLGEESHPPYQRPPLSKACLKGEVDERSLYLRQQSVYDRAPSGQSAGRLIHLYTKRNAALSINYPESGVWEFLVTDRHHAYRYDSAEYGRISRPVRIDTTLSLRSIDARVSESGGVVLRNSGSAFTGALVDSGLAQTAHRPLQVGVMPSIESIAVEPGSELLSVELDPQAGDADIFLFRCSDRPGCEFVSASMTYRGAKRIQVIDPPAGEYRAVIAAAASTEAVFTTTVISKRFGAVSTDDSKLPRAVGASWQPKVRLWNHGIGARGETVFRDETTLTVPSC